MTVILGIETATIEVSVALVSEDGRVGSVSVRGTRLQAETLHPAIAQLCEHCGISLGDLGAIAVDIGPGRFTGLRVGVAAAKALAYALGIPVLVACSTDILERSAALVPGPVVPVVDMRRGEVAYSLPAKGNSPELATPQQLGRLLADLGPVCPFLVGDGALRHREAIEATTEFEVRFGGDEHAAPRAEVLAELGLEQLGRGGGLDPYSVLPLYLRGPDVRIGWETRDPVVSPSFARAAGEDR